MNHLNDHDLERYYLGMVTEENELSELEIHILWCAWCRRRAGEVMDYIDAVRSAIISGDFDDDARIAVRAQEKGSCFGRCGGT